MRARSTEWGRPRGGEENHRPALQKLAYDQNVLIDSLRAGFDGLGDILGWCAEVNTRTLGRLNGEFYEQLATKLHVQWLTLEQRSSRELDPNRAEGFRKDLSLSVVSAADEAIRNYRSDATEYVDDETPTVVIDHEGAIAFRPALSEIEAKQKEVLKTGLIGFSSRDELAKWERTVQEATFGEYQAMPEYPVAKNIRGRPYQTLRADAGEPMPARYVYLINNVIPACIAGVRVLRNATQEQVTTGAKSLEDLNA